MERTVFASACDLRFLVGFHKSFGGIATDVQYALRAWPIVGNREPTLGSCKAINYNYLPLFVEFREGDNLARWLDMRLAIDG